MLETLKGYTKKSSIIRIIIMAVIVIGCLAFTRFAIFQVIMGPVKIDMTEDPSKYAGKWVTMDVDFVLTDYVSHSTKTTYQSGRTTTSTDGYSYIAFYPVDDYVAMTSTWYFYSFYMSKSDADRADSLLDKTWDYWTDETGTVEKPAPITVTGTWTELDGTLLRYYEETLTDDMDYEEDEYNIFLRYTIQSDKIGGVSWGVFIVLMVVAAAALIYGIVQVIKLFTGGCEKTFEAFIGKNPGTSMSHIESDFAAAHRIGKEKVWVGKNWTIYVTGTKVHIFANKNAVWAYYYRRTGRNSVSELRVFMKGENNHFISMSEANAHEALGYYSNEQPHMVLGYSADLEKMYKKNFQEFLNIKYNPAQQQDPFNNNYNQP